MSPSKRPSLVEQVRQSLLGDLTSGKLEPGAKLANENVLDERFGVSRSTIREAVGSLMDAGCLVRRHGSGTYVTASPRTRHLLETTVSYTAMIRASGHTPEETVVSKAVRAPAEDERELLGLNGGDPVIDVERVRLADRRPVIYSRDRIPATLLGDYAEAALDRSLYALLARAGHPVASATAQLIPTLANAKLSRLLMVKLARRCSTSIRSTSTSAAVR
jgi:GntR family transcriptional regulator